MPVRLIAAVVLALAASAAALAGEALARPRAAPATLELLARYQPVTMQYRSDWAPASIQSYLRRSELERRISGVWKSVRPTPAASSLPRGSRAYRLDGIPCTPASDLDACYRRAWPLAPAPTVYGRARTGPAQGQIGTVLQYWLFYPLNDWRDSPSRPKLWQMHEGDWETVLVGLSPEGQPVSAAYSQHRLGVVRAWSDVATVGDTHPVVYVALGSHANYFTPGSKGKAGVPHQIPTTFSGVPVAEPDFTSGQLSYGPGGVAQKTARIVDISTSSAAWLGFAGAWGDGGYLLAAGAPTKGVPVWSHARYGDSPVGPAYHKAWREPWSPFKDWPPDDGH